MLAQSIPRREHFLLLEQFTEHFIEEIMFSAKLGWKEFQLFGVVWKMCQKWYGNGDHWWPQGVERSQTLPLIAVSLCFNGLICKMDYFLLMVVTCSQVTEFSPLNMLRSLKSPCDIVNTFFFIDNTSDNKIKNINNVTTASRQKRQVALS